MAAHPGLPLTAKDVAGSLASAFVKTCGGGHLSEARLLLNKFGYDGPAPPLAHVGMAARAAACAGGHLDVADWLTGPYGFLSDTPVA